MFVDVQAKHADCCLSHQKFLQRLSVSNFAMDSGIQTQIHTMSLCMGLCLIIGIGKQALYLVFKALVRCKYNYWFNISEMEGNYVFFNHF